MSGILQTLFLGAAAAVKDAYFNLVTLLLNTTATNGAQNNTFLDSSTNNFSITRNGNTTQGTFTPFSQTGWSMYLPGTNSSYVRTPDSSLTNLIGGALTTSSVFTIECFVNMPAGGVLITGDANPGNDNANMLLGIESSGVQSFGGTFGGYTTRFGNVAINFNQWNHVAWVVNSGTVYFYVNGVSAGSGAIGNVSGIVGYLIFGGYNNNFTSKQYISNFRVTRSVVYSGAYTVPTTQLNALAGTTFLAFQTNRFKDNGPNNYSLVINGIPSVQAFSPFAPAYITPTTYSNYFDGSGDYLTWPSGAGVAFGTGDFTVEMFICPTTSINQVYLMDARNSGQTSSWAIGFNLNNTGNGQFTFFNGVAGAAYNESSQSCVLNQWNHCVVVRSGTTLSLFTNGTRVYTTTNSTDFSSSQTLSYISRGQGTGSELYYTGAMSNVRIVKGTAVYSPSATTLTVPTAPLTAISGTQLLTCQNSTFIDNSSNAFTISAFGNAQPVASPTPFAPTVETEAAAYSTTLVGGSAYFDGSGDYLVTPSSSNLALGTGAFTIECWFYTAGNGSDGLITSIDSGSGNYAAAIYFSGSTSVTASIQNNAAAAFGSGNMTFSLYTWNHVVLVRDSSGNCAAFLNGIRRATGTTSQNITQTTFNVGRTYINSGGTYVGYISGARIVKGSAVYDPLQTGFAPPLTPPTAVTNTQLLLNYTNAGIYDAAAKNVSETIGTAQVSTTQAKFGTTAMYFDGSSSSFLSIPFSQNLNLSTGSPDWTLECWAYIVSYSNSPYLFNKGGVAATYYTNYSFVIPSNGVAYMALGNNGGETGYNFGSVSTNTWYHFAATRQGNTIKTFLNGTLVTNTSIGAAMSDNGENLYVGVLKNLTTNVLNGYIDELRITKGYARYTATFTPPAAPFPVQ